MRAKARRRSERATANEHDAERHHQQRQQQVEPTEPRRQFPPPLHFRRRVAELFRQRRHLRTDPKIVQSADEQDDAEGRQFLHQRPTKFAFPEQAIEGVLQSEPASGDVVKPRQEKGRQSEPTDGAEAQAEEGEQPSAVWAYFRVAQ